MSPIYLRDISVAVVLSFSIFAVVLISIYLNI